MILMKRFGLIGNPISHSLSPALFRAGYHLDIPGKENDFCYDLIEGDDFSMSWHKFMDGYDGINVTAPFKERAFSRCSIIDPACRKIGAANLIIKGESRTKAYNTDYYGIILSILEAVLQESDAMDRQHSGCRLNARPSIEDCRKILDGKIRTALVAGCGGAGKAAAGSYNRANGGKAPDIIEITPALYEKVAYRGGTEGVIAEIYTKDTRLEDLALGKEPLIMVLESVEKPGNLGAVLRSADAAGADAVIICDPLTDLYNPNLIRASIGAVFTRQVVAASSEDTVKWLKDKGIKILTAQLQDSEWYYDTDMRGGVAIVMGTEATGLTDFWRKAADAHIRIPMLGSLDSLNVSVSAAILLYEAVRQRHLSGACAKAASC